MIGKLFDYIIGKNTFEIVLSKPSDVVILNYLQENGFFGCRVSEGKITVSCSCSKGKKVSDLLKQKNVTYKYTEYGLVAGLKRIFSRTGVVAAIVICVILQCVFSGIIWELNIEKCSVPEAEIRKTLLSLGVTEGVRKNMLDIKKLDIEYMLADDRFSWAHLNTRGTTANFEVKERIERPNPSPDKKEVCNIVAKCDGIVSRIDVYSGGKEVKAGDSVTKGQLLVSSFFETRTVGYLLRRAKGTVIATTEPVFEMTIPKKAYRITDKKVYTKHALSLFDKSVSIDGGNIVLDGKNADMSVKKEKLRLFGTIKVPILLVTRTYTVNDLEEYTRTEEMCEQIYREKYEEWKKEYSKDAEVLSSETQVTEQDGCYRFVTKLVCRENIGIDKPFEIRENNY